MRKPIPKPLSKTAATRHASEGGQRPDSHQTNRKATMFTGGKPIATVYVSIWRHGRKELPKPCVVHKGKRLSFPRIPNARAWALENGYAGIRVVIGPPPTSEGG